MCAHVHTLTLDSLKRSGSRRQPNSRQSSAVLRCGLLSLPLQKQPGFWNAYDSRSEAGNVKDDPGASWKPGARGKGKVTVFHVRSIHGQEGFL